MPALWMAWTVGALTVLSIVGGWIQFGNLWDPITTFLDPVAPTGVHATGVEEAVTSVLSVGLAVLGIGIAWWIYSARRAEVPRWAFGQQLLEHKFYFDELYDAVFYRPAVWFANAAARYVEGPLISGSIRELAEGTRLVGTRLSEAQTGLLRTYALALGSGAALLTLVFLAVKL
jgi:NADH-quinone oxidoreductase subunit L